MSGLILGFFTVLLILVSGFIALIVLMQRASSNSGMGASLGGGAAESALGGGASSVLVKGTIVGTILFFLISFGLYLGYTAHYNQEVKDGTALPGMIDAADEDEAPTELPNLTDVPASSGGSGTTSVNVTGESAEDATAAENALPTLVEDNTSPAAQAVDVPAQPEEQSDVETAPEDAETAPAGN